MTIVTIVILEVNEAHGKPFNTTVLRHMNAGLLGATPGTGVAADLIYVT